MILTQKNNLWHDDSGITLIELLITLAITGIVSAAIFSVYNVSLKTHTAQTQVADVQQDVRAGLFLMTSEIRMAGYDPTNLAGAGISFAGTDSIQFIADLNGDGDLIDSDDKDGDGDTAEGDPDENLTFSLYSSDGIQKLGRNATGTQDPLVENAEALGFAYAIDDGNGRLRNNAVGTMWVVIGPNGNWFDLDDNEDGDINALDDAADGATDGTIKGRDTNITANTDDIRAVRVWLLARSGVPDVNYANSQSYIVGDRIVDANDNFRRRLLTTTVKCRNMGL